MTDLVSILIPAYNAEQWIGDTVKSAINQTWPKKEIIIVDDGSTDSTLMIAKTFESANVKVITQNNMGASCARNKALGFAQGSYLQWLDGDDLLAPDKIVQQLKGADRGVETRTLLSSCFGTFYFRQRRAQFKPNSLWQDLPPVEWLVNKFNDIAWMNPAVWLVSRKLTDLAGIWDERLSLDDDGEYFARLVAASTSVKFIGSAKSYYRIGNTGSLSRKTSYKACESLYLSVNRCIEHLLTLEDSDRTRRACLHYLNDWLIYFYPEKRELIDKMSRLATQLGGHLDRPTLGWKYYPLEKLLGTERARQIRTNWGKSKLLMKGRWDKLLYRLVE